MSRGRGSSHYDGKIAGLYDLGDTLGRGHFAVVKLAKHVFTGEQVAVKVIDKTKLDDVSRAHLFQEVRCMKLVQHPNVVRLYEVIDTQTKLYLILELGDGGDMYDYIIKHENGVDEETAKKYFRQIVHAISYCHKLHVVHRDLKPENVVFFEKLGMVKLTDFGFSNKFCPGQKLETSCGSLAYSAPEILLGDSYDAPKVDVWSLGVILYMLVCGHAPFQEANDSETLTMIMDCKYTIPQYVSESCCRLIECMLIRDPDKRATLEEITCDPWLNSGDAIQPADYLPLVSREHLSEEDHTHIIQKMVNGSIATKEEILEALDKNEYNHITATYFLLAERKLRAQRQEKAQLLNSRISRTDLSPVAVTPGISSAVPSPAQERPLATLESLVSPCLPSKPLEVRHFGSHLVPPGPVVPSPLNVQGCSALPLQRKCSIVREEEDNCSTASANSSPSKSPVAENKPLCESFDQNASEVLFKCRMQKPENDVLSQAIALIPFQKVPNPRSVLSLPVMSNSLTLVSPQHRPKVSAKQSLTSSVTSQKFKTVPSHGRRLHSVQSSPQLPLNEINEEKESEESSQRRRSSKGHIHSSVVPHFKLKVVEQHKSRTASCSSLEISDEDDSKKSKLVISQDANKENNEDLNDCGKEGGGSSDSGQENSGQSRSLQDSSSSVIFNSNGSETNDNSGHESHVCEDFSKSIKNTHFTHAVYSVDSTDSLDFLSDSQPRLVNSMSCGDLSSDVNLCLLQNRSVLQSDSISLSEIPQVADENGPPTFKTKCQDKKFIEDHSTLKFRYPISNSLSLNSGLCTFQKKQNLKDISTHPEGKASDKNRTMGIGFGKLVQSSSRSDSKNQLDINQNGWKKSDSKKSTNAGSSQQAVVDMKMASKCCTLC